MALAAVSFNQPVAAEDIVVAAVATRPGAQQLDGADLTGAVELALREVNRRGGLLGRPLRLVAYEEDCSQATAETIAGQIVARGATLVVGHLCSAAAIAAAPVYARHGIMLITPGARSPRLTEPRAGGGIFRLAGRDDRFGAETAALIGQRFAARRIAVIHDLSVQARALADSVDRELKARSITPVLRASYIAGERAYNAVVDQLLASEADVIIVPAQPVEAGIIIDGLRARNVAATLIGSEILAVPAMEATGRRLGDSFIVMLPWLPPANGPIKIANRASVSAVAVRSRAAIEAWAAAVTRAGALDEASVARILETQSVPTAAGPVRFDVKGDAVLPSFAPHAWRTYSPGEPHAPDRTGDWRPLAPLQ